MTPAEKWIKKLGLERHPEGGWFRRIYTSETRNESGRPVLTSIYYLLEQGDFSALHRLKQDEQWHFYAGSPITIHEIDAERGAGKTTTLSAEGPFQYTVKAGCFFGATVSEGFALVGCSVAPGFDFADFELPSRAELLRRFPQHEALILKLTRE